MTVKEQIERIETALDSDNKSQVWIAEVGLDWITTLLAKNADYGSSVWNPPVLKPDMAPEDAILVRMSDKIARIASLQNSDAQVDESMEDSIKDLGAYCLLQLARPGRDE